MLRTDLIGSILEIAGDYRKGEIAEFNEEHVERWVDQFPVSKECQDVILFEVGNMLKNFYYPKKRMKKYLERMFEIMPEERAGGCRITDVQFLKTQEEGKSQHALLLLADEILQNMHGCNVDDCGGSNVYLYLDDCLYSGNKWRYDIRDSVQLASSTSNMRLVSFHAVMYSEGSHYAKEYVNSYLAKKNGKVKPFRYHWFENNRFGHEKLDVIWPVYVEGNKHIDVYAEYLKDYCNKKGWAIRRLFRTDQDASSNVFSSLQNQHIVEQAFLAVGAKLFCAARNPAPSMRPMGFEVLATIGFGTPIVTWRNIPNNAPLALWYGDPEVYDSNHPLGMWYPLFPRKA